MKNQTHQQLFTDIKYRGAKIDQGLVIAERRNRWDLKRWRNPAQHRRNGGGQDRTTIQRVGRRYHPGGYIRSAG